MRISIDCWGTLLKSSPAFTEEKIKLTNEYFPSMSESRIINSFSKTKHVFNEVIEFSGGMQPNQRQIFSYLLSMINNRYAEFPFIEEYIQRYQSLAILYPPVWYSE
jgi:FMN phosphatase YigB (HAD superfamily)